MLLRNALIGLGTVALLTQAACDEPKKPEPKKKPVATAAPTPTPSAKPEKPADTQAPRPRNLKTELTDAQRKKIEAAHPEAKGFLEASKLEAAIKKKKPKAKEPAMKELDKLAKGKWILFIGPTTNVKPKVFDMGVTYTPRVEGDRIGLSRQFFLVNFSDIKGYDEKRLRNGTMVAVLAKYTGKGKAVSGFELVEEKNF